MTRIYGSKYLVIMKNPKGRYCVIRVKAVNAQEATVLAAAKWPKYSVHTVRSSIIL